VPLPHSEGAAVSVGAEAVSCAGGASGKVKPASDWPGETLPPLPPCAGPAPPRAPGMAGVLIDGA